MAHEKLKEALHYVIENCDDASRLGAIRLNKIMWFADCHAFRTNGVSITGDSYVKRKFGPVPQHVLAALRALQEEEKIAVREVAYTTRKTLREFSAKVESTPHSLSAEDRETLKSYAEIICHEFTAAQISEISHDQVWDAADEGEEIPLYTIFASQAGAINDPVRAWANGVVEKIAA